MLCWLCHLLIWVGLSVGTYIVYCAGFRADLFLLIFRTTVACTSLFLLPWRFPSLSCVNGLFFLVCFMTLAYILSIQHTHILHPNFIVHSLSILPSPKHIPPFPNPTYETLNIEHPPAYHELRPSPDRVSLIPIPNIFLKTKSSIDRLHARARAM